MFLDSLIWEQEITNGQEMLVRIKVVKSWQVELVGQAATLHIVLLNIMETLYIKLLHSLGVWLHAHPPQEMSWLPI